MTVQKLIYKYGTLEIEFLERLYSLKKNKKFFLNCGKLKLNDSASYLAKVFCMDVKKIKEHLSKLQRDELIKLSRGGIEILYGIRDEN